MGGGWAQFSSPGNRASPTAGTRRRPQPNPRVALPWRSPSGWPTHRNHPSSPSTHPLPICNAMPSPTSISQFCHTWSASARRACFILFRASFIDSGLSEYFLYKAGDDESLPLLDRIPSPYEFDVRESDDLRGVREFGVLQLPGGGHEYLVAALCLAPSSSDDYHLQIYSSERKSWSTSTLPNPCPGVGRIMPDKVITLEDDGLLGWVDLSQGLLVCDLLQDHHLSFFIPLPEPLPGNRYKLKCPIPPSPFAKRRKKSEDESHQNLWWFRDLVCVDGVLKLIEMENLLAPANRSDQDDVIYDSDLIMSLERKAVDWNPKQLPFRGAWRAVTWTRAISSSNWSNCWRQTCAADVADILVDDDELVHSSLLSGLKGKKFTFRDLYSAFPILSPDGDDFLYLKSLVEPSDKDGWVAAVDLGNKAVKAIEKYNLPDDFYYYSFRDPAGHPFRACTLVPPSGYDSRH